MSSPIAKRSHPDSEDDSDYVPPAYQREYPKAYP